MDASDRVRNFYTFRMNLFLLEHSLIIDYILCIRLNPSAAGAAPPAPRSSSGSAPLGPPLAPEGLGNLDLAQILRTLSQQNSATSAAAAAAAAPPAAPAPANGSTSGAASSGDGSAPDQQGSTSNGANNSNNNDEDQNGGEGGGSMEQ